MGVRTCKHWVREWASEHVNITPHTLGAQDSGGKVTQDWAETVLFRDLLLLLTHKVGMCSTPQAGPRGVSVLETAKLLLSFHQNNDVARRLNPKLDR